MKRHNVILCTMYITCTSTQIYIFSRILCSERERQTRHKASTSNVNGYNEKAAMPSIWMSYGRFSQTSAHTRTATIDHFFSTARTLNTCQKEQQQILNLYWDNRSLSSLNILYCNSTKI